MQASNVIHGITANSNRLHQTRSFCLRDSQSMAGPTPLGSHDNVLTRNRQNSRSDVSDSELDKDKALPRITRINANIQTSEEFPGRWHTVCFSSNRPCMRVGLIARAGCQLTTLCTDQSQLQGVYQADRGQQPAPPITDHKTTRTSFRLRDRCHARKSRKSTKHTAIGTTLFTQGRHGRERERAKPAKFQFPPG